MELLIWSVIFIVSLVALVKAADWIVQGAQAALGKSGTAAMAALAVGAALPELAAALAAVSRHRPELAAAAVIGASIANILLVVGALAVFAKGLLVKKEYLEADAPMLAAGAAVFYFIAADGAINPLEGLLLAVIFFVYAAYVFPAGRRRDLTPVDLITPGNIGSGVVQLVEMVPTRVERMLGKISGGGPFWKTLLLLLAGVALLVVAANFAVDSLVNISGILAIPATITTMVVLAAAAALPELFAGLAIIRKKQRELTLGNIFAATTANLLLVCGLAALFTPLPLDGVTRLVGLPFLAVSAGLLVVSAFAKKIGFGQGMMFLFLYFLFFVKLFNLF